MLVIYFPKEEWKDDDIKERFSKIKQNNRWMLNVGLITSVSDVEEKVDTPDKLSKYLKNFIDEILTSIGIEIWHLVNTKNEGIIVTPVDTDSSSEAGI